jgi:2-polyprenyl-3-methyl-5-hydroxy-6-metoxy-1,4-benzoquinol methylase
MESNGLTYDASVFDKVNIEDARQIVLSDEAGVSCQTRWETETPWLLTLIGENIKSGSLIVDYGCGVGRLSNPLAEPMRRFSP